MTPEDDYVKKYHELDYSTRKSNLKEADLLKKLGDVEQKLSESEYAFKVYKYYNDPENSIKSEKMDKSTATEEMTNSHGETANCQQQ